MVVKVKMVGKYYCKAPKDSFPEECEYKTKTGLCRIRDLSCMFLDYQAIVKVIK